MIIKELTIYGYGKFEQFQMENLSSLQVIYGPNEAGKSTIMSFIHSVLFGFPSKVSNEIRFEPKLHSKYGGQLVIQTEHHGLVRIERVKGKAAGDVTVILDNGITGGEELLQELIGKMDKNLYQGIFSFNIHGLQNIHQLKGEELNRYLLSASAIGTDRLMAAEQLFEKEMDKWFKRNGVKPLINKKLAEIKNLEAKVNESKQKIDSYEALLTKRSELEEAISDKYSQINALDDEIRKKREWNRIFPLVKEKKQIKAQLQKLGDIKFPKDGRKTLERLESDSWAIEKQLAPLKQQYEKIQNEMEAVQINHIILENEEHIQHMIDQLPRYSQMKDQLSQLTVKIENLVAEEKRVLYQLGIKELPTGADQFDLSFAVKEQISKLESERDYLLEKEKDLKDEERRLQQSYREKRELIAELEKKKLTEEEWNHCQLTLDNAGKKQELETRLQWITEQLQIVGEKDPMKERSRKYIIFIFAAILSVIAIGLFLFDMEQLALGLFISAILFLFYSFYNVRSASKRDLSASLQQQKAECEKKLNNLAGIFGDPRDAKNKMDRHMDVVKNIEMENLQLQQINRQLQDHEQNVLLWKSRYQRIQNRLVEIGSNFHLNKNLSIYHLSDSFILLEKLQNLQIEKNQCFREKIRLEKMLGEIAAELMILEKTIPLQGADFSEKVIQLKQILLQEEERETIYRRQEEKARELNESIQTYQEQLRMIEYETKQLFQQANVKTREEFLKLGENYDLLNKYETKLKMLEQQLTGFAKLESEYLEGAVSDEEFQELELKKETIRQEAEGLEKERADAAHQIHQIEEGGTYPELIQKFHQEKYELKEMAKEWSAFAAARFVLQKTMEKYKKEKLPAIFETASDYFARLTKGNYERVWIQPEKDQIMVKRKDGLFFSPEELSQATGEQLYISIRFALVSSLNKKWKYPIMIDDGFVNFDGDRLAQMMDILHNLAEHQQIIFFTCHKPLAELFERQNVFSL